MKTFSTAALSTCLHTGALDYLEQHLPHAHWSDYALVAIRTRLQITNRAITYPVIILATDEKEREPLDNFGRRAKNDATRGSEYTRYILYPRLTIPPAHEG